MKMIHALSGTIPPARPARLIAGMVVISCILLAACSVSAMNAVGQIPPAPMNSYSETGGIQLWTNPGDAYIEVTPTNGAMAYGGWSGSTGSYTLSRIPAYVNYQITVNKAGYKPYVSYLYVNPNIYAEDHPQLVLDTPDPGHLDMTIKPYGGTVCIDGTQCETYPFDPQGELSRQVRNLDGNQYHTVTVVLTGYRPFSQDVWVPAGDYGRLQATLQHW